MPFRRTFQGVFQVVLVAAFLCCAKRAAGSTSQYPTNWTFEANTQGTVYVDVDGNGIADGWQGEPLPRPAGVVSNENYVYQYTGPFALPATLTHTNVLSARGFLKNTFTAPPATLHTNVQIGFMIRPGQLRSEPELDGVPQLAMYVNTNGHLVVRHAYYPDSQFHAAEVWSELSHDPIGTNDWAHVTVILDYDRGAFPVENYFSVAVAPNGGGTTLITNALAYKDFIDDSVITTPGLLALLGGHLFLTADSGYEDGGGVGKPAPNDFISSLDLSGAGAIDDLRVLTEATRTARFLFWRLAYGLEGEDGDDDNDGSLNWEEYLAGTIPTNPASLFAVVDEQYIGATNWISWQGGTNSGVTTDFMVYRTTNFFAAGDGWERVASNITRNASGTNTWADPNTPTGVAAFYQPRLPNTEQE